MRYLKIKLRNKKLQIKILSQQRSCSNLQYSKNCKKIISQRGHAPALSKIKKQTGFFGLFCVIVHNLQSY